MEEGRGPERRCIVSGKSGDKSLLIRCVIGPDGSVVPDIDGKLPGRGLWLTADRAIVQQAVKKGAFPRAARRAVSVPADLADRIAALLARRCISMLGLARRAGLVTTGFVKVGEMLQAGRVTALVQAADASEDGRAKLARQARGLPRVELLTTAELGLALGKENVVHAALSPGGLTSSFLAEARRLAGFRSPTLLTSVVEPTSLDHLSKPLSASGPELA